MNEEDEELFEVLQSDYGCLIKSAGLYEEELKSYVSAAVTESLIKWYYAKLRQNEK